LSSGCDGVVVPRVFDEITTGRILVTELASGEDFESFCGRASQSEKDRAADIIYRFVYESIFRHGLFNADPNPGNYLLDERGVTFLDFGCMTRFPADHLARWRSLVRAILERDFARRRPLDLRRLRRKPGPRVLVITEVSTPAESRGLPPCLSSC
jgi:predicted unusual protein kinase regulating ubiquinone biosynthesis (AarF/ABC1/UbiB family)